MSHEDKNPHIAACNEWLLDAQKARVQSIDWGYELGKAQIEALLAIAVELKGLREQLGQTKWQR